jgi:N-sulfoglucosamine sulfohydrolase
MHLDPILLVRRTRGCYMLAAILLLGWTGLFTPQSATGAPPNILWITVEDMSPRLGCYGDHTVPTPNIDQLATESVRYTRAFGVYGVCSPNRHTLILGMYPTSTGAMAMRTWKRTAALDQVKDPKLLAIPTYEATPPPLAHCFTQYLRAAGYYCTNNVKTDYQFRDPITAWDESSNKAHWRNRPAPDTPFFSVFNYTVTHESGTFKQCSPIVVDPSKVTLPPYYPDRPLLRQDLARHYDNIAVLDRQVGDLLKQLREDELLKNTIIFFFSDHGDGLPRMKRWVYDSGIQVPLLIRYPDQQQSGTINEELVSFVDFAPSVLSLTGIPIPGHMQGQAFLGSQQQPPRKYIYAARDRMDPAPETIRAVRDKRFKYVRNYRTDLPYIGFIPYRDRAAGMKDLLQLIEQQQLGPDQWQFSARKKPLEELYDTHHDPHEIHNLAAEPRHLEKLAELRSAHLAWTAQTKDLGHLAETDLIKKLWPPAGIQPTTASPIVSWKGSRRKGKPLMISLQCATEGASIAYRLSKSSRWLLYNKPFSASGTGTVSTTAIRLGWKPSPTVEKKFP